MKHSSDTQTHDKTELTREEEISTFLQDRMDIIEQIMNFQAEGRRVEKKCTVPGVVKYEPRVVRIQVGNTLAEHNSTPALRTKATIIAHLKAIRASLEDSPTKDQLHNSSKDTYTLFLKLQKEWRLLKADDDAAGFSVETLKRALRLCLSINQLCTEKTHNISMSCHPIYRRAIIIHDYCASIYPEEREILEAYTAIVDKYRRTAKPGASSQLSRLLNTSQHRPVEVEPITHELDENLLIQADPLHPDYADSGFTLEELQGRYETVSVSRKNKISVKTALFNLLHDTELYIHTLRLHKENPELDHQAMIQTIEFALEVNAAYISHLKRFNNQKNLFPLYKAIQRAAHLFRTLHYHYKQTGLSESSEATLKRSVLFMQDQAMNIQQMLVCLRIESSYKTSGEEKGNAQKLRESYTPRFEAGLTRMCNAYHALLDPNNSYTATDDVTNQATKGEDYATLFSAFLVAKTTHPAQDFFPFFMRARSGLNQKLNQLMPLEHNEPTYFQYIDSEYLEPDDRFNLESVTHLEAQTVRELGQVIKLYYDTRLSYLENLSDDFVSTQRFIAAYRQKAYAYLLDIHIGMSTINNLAFAKENCDEILASGDCLTPMLRALAMHALKNIHQLQADQEASFAGDTPANVAEVTAIKSNEAIPLAVKQSTPSEGKKQEADDTTTIWTLVAQKYPKLSAPGWEACYAEVSALLKAEQAEKALSCVTQWLENAPENIHAKSVHHHQAIFDALMCRVDILKSLARYDEALTWVEQAQAFLTDKAYISTLNAQIQKLICEKGILLSKTDVDPDEVQKQFNQAHEKAAEIDAICYTALREQTKHFTLSDINQDTIAVNAVQFLLNASDAISVDKYNVDAFYDFYKQVAHEYCEHGLKQLENSIAAHALHNGSERLLSSTDIETAITLYTRLLNYSQSNQHIEQQADLLVILGDLHYKLQLLNAQRHNVDNAREYFQAALNLPTSFDEATRQRIKNSLNNLDNITPIRNSAIAGLLNISTQEKMEIVLGKEAKVFTTILGDIVSQDAHLKMVGPAITQHTNLSQIKNLLFILKKMGSFGNNQQAYYQLYNKMLCERSSVSTIIMGNYQAAMRCIDEELTEQPDSISLLTQKANAIAILKAKATYMLSEQEDELKSESVSSLSQNTIAILNECTTTLKACYTRIIKLGGQLSDCLLLKDAMAHHLSHIDLEISAQAEEKLSMEADMPEAYKEALEHIRNKRCWQALECLLELLNRGHIPKAKKIPIHFLMTKLFAYFLRVLHSAEFLDTINTENEQGPYIEVASLIKNLCMSYLNILKSGYELECKGLKNSLKHLPSPEVLLRNHWAQPVASVANNAHGLFSTDRVPSSSAEAGFVALFPNS